MDFKFIKGIFLLILLIVSLTYTIVFFYNNMILSTLAILRGDDYVDFDPKQFPLLLFLPVMAIIDVILFCLLFPFRKKLEKMVEKMMVPLGVYSFFALIIGSFISLIVSFYPLSVHYYKCNSTSIISSGSYYARTKEMCKERSRLRSEERESNKAGSGMR